MKVQEVNGKFRVRKMIEGKVYSKTFDTKPTKKEINEWIREVYYAAVTQNNAPNQSFYKCAVEYLKVKDKVLSPSTLRSYDSYLRNMPESFTNMKMKNINHIVVQKLVNDISAEKSPKTVRNYHAFISAVIGMFVPTMVLNTTLPQKEKKEEYIPMPWEVSAVIEQAKIEKYRILFMLGAYGLRRSEAICITADDVEGNIVHVTKAYVLGLNNKWELKGNKTYESTRDVPISDDLADDIRKIGVVYSGHPSKVLIYLNRCQDRAGVPHFKFHSLRHFFVTELSQAGFSDADIMRLAGYSSTHVFKSVYRHSRIQNEEQRQIEAANTIRNLI